MLKETEYYLENIHPIVMVGVGIIGNIIVFSVLSRKKFKHVPSINYLKLNAINDILGILTILLYHTKIFGKLKIILYCYLLNLNHSSTYLKVLN